MTSGISTVLSGWILKKKIYWFKKLLVYLFVIYRHKKWTFEVNAIVIKQLVGLEKRLIKKKINFLLIISSLFNVKWFFKFLYKIPRIFE